MKVTLRAPVNSLGYGYAGVGYLAGLLAAGAEVDLSLIGHVGHAREIFKEMDLYNISILSDKPDPKHPVVVFWGFGWKDEIAHSTKYDRYFISTFEEVPKELPSDCRALGTASKYWLKYLPSERRILAPHAVYLDEDTLFLPESGNVDLIDYFDIPAKGDLLLVSNIGKHEPRKGTYELLEAVSRVERPVVLFISCYNPFNPVHLPIANLLGLGFDFFSFTKGSFVYRKGDRFVVLVPRMASRSDLLGLMRSTDLYISPSISEGWDLPLFEMMSLGHPCAATICTAHRDYCTTENCIPIDVVDLEGEKTHEDDLILPSVESMVRIMEGDIPSLDFRPPKLTWKQAAENILSAVEEDA